MKPRKRAKPNSIRITVNSNIQKLEVPRNSTLRHLVEMYQILCRHNLRENLEGFKRMDFSKALETAAMANESNGKRMAHLHRAPKDKLETAKVELTKKAKELARCKNFDDLFSKVEKIVQPIKKLKKMYVYDVALRIGVSNGIWPGKVYLQCGALTGARNLFKTWKPDEKVKPAPFDNSVFPGELHCLNAAEIEDFLCIFEEHLNGVRR